MTSFAKCISLITSLTGVLAKNASLELTFRSPTRRPDEIILGESVYLLLGDLRTYVVQVKDRFAGRVIGQKTVRNFGWQKITLNVLLRAMKHRAKTALELSAFREDGNPFNFQDYFKDGKQLMLYLLIHYRDVNSQGSMNSIMNTNQRYTATAGPDATISLGRRKKRKAATSCSYINEDLYSRFNLSLLKPLQYSPKTTKVCQGLCSPKTSSATTCDVTKQNCCVPLVKVAFVVLYDLNGTIVLKRFPDAVVTKCGCARQGAGSKG